ncbi:MAG: glycine zipper family protein [Pseudomonadota bacterium]
MSLSGLIALGAACSNTGAGYAPVTDGTRNATYTSDLAACQSLARSQPIVDGETGNAVLIGAGLGAALGAVDDDGDAAEGAIAGAIGGVLADTLQTPKERKRMVIVCMQNRGHRVAG